MAQIRWSKLLLLSTQIPVLFAYPRSSPEATVELDTRADNFIFGAIGDSWSSGVSYAGDNEFDGNKDNCRRYKYAWSTVVNASYTEWMPDGIGPEFEFKACSGAHLGDMMNQMDLLTRPKVVLMEAGGNDAIFYPMADACLFHADRGRKLYGTPYEKDDPSNPSGECRKEINLVRDRVKDNGIKDLVVKTINDWRGHKAVAGNDASLFLLGYPWFFAYSKECDDWNFEVPWAKETQNVVMDMRKDFNSMIDEMNRGIREGAASFNDPKIQYIDINPAFDGHRFCEEGHSYWDQLNYGANVHIWNNPAKWIITIQKGSKVNTYDTSAEPPQVPPEDDFNNLFAHPDGGPRQDGDNFILAFRDPTSNDIMELKAAPNDFGTLGVDLDGSVSRTLHPTKEGHEDMGNIVVERLKQDFKDQNETPSPTSTPPAAPLFTPPPPRPSPTKALSIILMHHDPNHGPFNVVDVNPPSYSWVFYETNVGKSAVCGANGANGIHISTADSNADIDNPPWPGGTYDFNLYGESCEFKCDGNDPGALFCPSFGGGSVGCSEDWGKAGGKTLTSTCDGNKYGITEHPVVTCEW